MGYLAPFLAQLASELLTFIDRAYVKGGVALVEGQVGLGLD